VFDFCFSLVMAASCCAMAVNNWNSNPSMSLAFLGFGVGYVGLAGMFWPGT